MTPVLMLKASRASGFTVTLGGSVASQQQELLASYVSALVSHHPGHRFF